MTSSLTGVYAGIVVGVGDPHNRGRARLRVPQIMGTAVTGWAEPVSVGAVAPGDQVNVAFEGGDPNYPLYWPKYRAGLAYGSDWMPLTLEPGWSASAVSGEGPPVVRLTGDGMLEFHGIAVGPTSVAKATNVTFARLPQGLVPRYTSYQMVASNMSTAYNARQSLSTANTSQSTTSTTFTTLSSSPLINFTAPASGDVHVGVGAWMKSSGATDTAYMSFTVLQGGTEILAPFDDRSAVVTGTAFAAAWSEMWVTNLTPGAAYSLEARYRSATSTGSSATFDTKRLKVSPTFPYTSPHARVGVLTDGSLTALFPNGSASNTIGLAGVRARAA
ncbi:phage baseplate assembly protein V [Actinacidiphila glaucinigra]|uniref:phage baseplate assembly protein V n=1 Tax=Actinacidiphila glaucinigra TaxID=235986 RepID=UPI003670057E